MAAGLIISDIAFVPAAVVVINVAAFVVAARAAVVTSVLVIIAALLWQFSLTWFIYHFAPWASLLFLTDVSQLLVVAMMSQMSGDCRTAAATSTTAVKGITTVTTIITTMTTIEVRSLDGDYV